MPNLPLRVAFDNNSIVVINVKYGYRVQHIKRFFSQFGRIVKIKSQPTFFCSFVKFFIRYEHQHSVETALRFSGKIKADGKPFIIRGAFNIPNVEMRQPQRDRNVIEEEETLELHPMEGELDNLNEDNSEMETHCICRRCEKFRHSICRERFHEVLMIYEQVKRHQNSADVENLSLRLMELKANYRNLVLYYRHNNP